jgi:hypothetical protein
VGPIVQFVICEWTRRVPKFSGVHCIDLHIPINFGADFTRIHFIGLKGEFTEVKGLG